MKTRVRLGLLLLGGLLGAATRAEADERPEAVPYRPTVSTPAALSAPFWLEGEFGGLLQHVRDGDDGGAHRGSVPYTLKLAFSEDWGVRVGGEAVVLATNADGSKAWGFGDTALVGKRRFAIDDVSACGLELGVLLPTARRGLESGTGKPDWSANGIYSADFAGWHGDVNLSGTRAGARHAGQSRLQELAALAVSRPIGDRWTAEAEWSGTRQHGAHGTAQLLAAMSWAIRRDLVFDVGTARGVNRATPTWQAFGGVTVVMGRID